MSQDSRGRTIAYWILTALIALPLLGSGVANLTAQPTILESFKKLGYPSYFHYILGTWKVLGALAILAPGFPRLKEWAHAGVTFSMTGAFASHLLAGDPIGESIAPLFLAGIALGSWALRPESRRLS